MPKKCLYCYQSLDDTFVGDFHEQCSFVFFGTKQQPLFEHSLKQMVELAKNVVERSIALPGVQPKLSLSIVNDTIQDATKGRLTVVGALGGNYIFKTIRTISRNARKRTPHHANSGSLWN